MENVKTGHWSKWKELTKMVAGNKQTNRLKLGITTGKKSEREKHYLTMETNGTTYR